MRIIKKLNINEKSCKKRAYQFLSFSFYAKCIEYRVYAMLEKCMRATMKMKNDDDKKESNK